MAGSNPAFPCLILPYLSHQQTHSRPKFHPPTAKFCRDPLLKTNRHGVAFQFSPAGIDQF